MWVTSHIQHSCQIDKMKKTVINDKINCNIWPKTPFCIQQLTSPSLYTNRHFSSNQFVSNAKTQKMPSDDICIIFLVADHRTISTTLSRIWCIGWTLCESQAVLALLSHPKCEPPQQNVPCLVHRCACCPISWWCPFPEGGRIPMACCLPLARSSLRDFCWSLLKLYCQHHGLEGTSCLLSELRYASVLRVGITFHSQRMRSSWNPPTLSDPFHWLSPSLQEALLLVYMGRE